MSLITVSGHLKDAGGNPIAGSVVFQLVNYGASIPRVLGTNAIVPTSVTLTANASGAFSGSVQGNDSIDPGGTNSPPTTYYATNFRDANGSVIQSVPFNFTGAGPANLDTQAPLVTIPSIPLPPSALAGNNTWTGSNTFTGQTTINDLISPALVVPFSATPTFNATASSVFQITLTANVTSSTLSAAVAGQLLLFRIIENNVGGFTFAWPTNVKTPMAITATANTVNQQLFWFDGTNAYPVAPGTFV